MSFSVEFYWSFNWSDVVNWQVFYLKKLVLDKLWWTLDRLQFGIRTMGIIASCDSRIKWKKVYHHTRQCKLSTPKLYVPKFTKSTVTICNYFQNHLAKRGSSFNWSVVNCQVIFSMKKLFLDKLWWTDYDDWPMYYEKISRHAIA